MGLMLLFSKTTSLNEKLQEENIETDKIQWFLIDVNFYNVWNNFDIN